MTAVGRIRSNFFKLVLWLNHRVETTGAQYYAFGLFGVINYPLSYFMWHDAMKIYNPLLLRLIAAFLCLLLIFHKHWPKKYQLYLPLYWYLTILYCLPFFETHILLMNHSSAWVVNLVLALFLFTVLVDWLMFIILLFAGVGIACLFNYVFDGGAGVAPVDTKLLLLAGYMYFVAIVIGLVFSRNKEKMAYARLQSMQGLALNIAHELRTPLAAVSAGVSGVGDYLRNDEREELKEVLQCIDKEVTSANSVINMLLMNLTRNRIDPQKFEICSMQKCVDQALKRYPFSASMTGKVHWEKDKDFEFKGLELWMIHVLFNLLKNSIFYIKSAGKGEIRIWIECGDSQNKLYFEDTGEGVDKEALSRIFNQFYSKTHHGYGIGLAFCKQVMHSFGGSISCQSVKGEYTKFILVFPKNK